MSSSKLAFAVRAAVTLVGGLALNHCVVRTTPVRTAGTINVQPGTTTVQTQPVYAQPQPVYAQPQPVYAQPQPVYVQQQPVYQAPQPVVGGGVQVNAGVGVGVGMGAGVAVGNGWVTDGYAQNDFVSYNMTMRARQFAAGYFPVTQLYRAQMGQGQHQFVTVQIAPGRCYRIIGVGGPGVQDLDLRIRDMNNNVVDQDVATDNFPVLGLNRQLCPTWNGTFQVEIIMYSGGGDIGVQAFASP